MAGNAYAEYLALDELLSLQRCRTQADSELLFITIHQADELWFKLLIHELRNAIRALYAGEELAAYKILARGSRIQTLLIETWDVLATLTPTEYQVFRDTVGRNGASGFQSVQNREVEFLLGETARQRSIDTPDGTRHIDVIDMQADEATRQRLLDCWKAPNLYDAVTHCLASRFPESGLRPRDPGEDHSAPRPFEPALSEIWLEIYRHPEQHMSSYQLGEKLIDIEDAQRRWRFMHLTTVARVIGASTGTGGSTGLRYLQKTAVEGMESHLYPELWHVRNTLFKGDTR